MTRPTDEHNEALASLPTLALRGALGGVLMGLANLVPGISGGTMLLAAGVYERFISAIADVTTLRLKPRSLVLLTSVGVAAALGILLLAGPVKDLVVGHRWLMYSLFIGLTLGGLPVVWTMATPVDRRVGIGAAIGLAVMIGLVAMKALGVAGAGGSNFFTLLVAGLAGASAMILPGVSGGYLLLLLGQYVPILAGIEAFKDALQSRDLAAAMGPALGVMLPVGIGVVLGIVAVSNLLRWLLLRHRETTLGVLIGLLLGSVVGLWPFQEPVQPEIGSTVKATVVTTETLAEIDPEDWPTQFFRPSPGQAVASVLLILVGVATTVGISRIGSTGRARPTRAG